MKRSEANQLRKIAYSWSDAAKDFLPGIGVYALTRALGGSNGLGLGLGAAASAIGAYGRRNWWNEKPKGQQTQAPRTTDSKTGQTPGVGSVVDKQDRQAGDTPRRVPPTPQPASSNSSRPSNTNTEGSNTAPFKSRLTKQQLSEIHDLLDDVPDSRRIIFEALGIPNHEIEQYSHQQWKNID